MPSLRTFVIALSLAAIVPASAHSLKELETALGDREQYFQSIDKDAPGFVLQGADGRTVSLADFRGKVVAHGIFNMSWCRTMGPPPPARHCDLPRSLPNVLAPNCWWLT